MIFFLKKYNVGTCCGLDEFQTFFSQQYPLSKQHKRKLEIDRNLSKIVHSGFFLAINKGAIILDKDVILKKIDYEDEIIQAGLHRITFNPFINSYGYRINKSFEIEWGGAYTDPEQVPLDRERLKLQLLEFKKDLYPSLIIVSEEGYRIKINCVLIDAYTKGVLVFAEIMQYCYRIPLVENLNPPKIPIPQLIYTDSM